MATILATWEANGVTHRLVETGDGTVLQKQRGSFDSMEEWATFVNIPSLNEARVLRAELDNLRQVLAEHDPDFYDGVEVSDDIVAIEEEYEHTGRTDDTTDVWDAWGGLQ